MLKGKYIGPDNMLSLKREEEYYLFPNGHSHAYVSRFPSKGSHTGCFERSLFQTVETVETTPEQFNEPTRTPISLDPQKTYYAKLVWRPEGYKSTSLKSYYISPKITHGYFFEDKALTKCRGCFPLHWFQDFKEITGDNDYIIEETSQFEHNLDTELATIESNLTSIIVNETENESKLNFEQLSLFD